MSNEKYEMKLLVQRKQQHREYSLECQSQRYANYIRNAHGGNMQGE